MGRPRDGLGPPPPSLPLDRVYIQRPPPRHSQTDYHLNQAPSPSPQTRKYPRAIQLSFLQPHFVVQRPPFQVVLQKLQHGVICFSRRLTPSPLPRLPRPTSNGCYLQGRKRRRIYTRNVYKRVPYRENTIQYASAGGATDWRQTRVPPQRMRLKTNKTRDFHDSAGCRHFGCTKILTVDPRHIALK